MKAAVLQELNAPLAIKDVGLTELDYGQVLVKVLASGICGSQLKEIAGEKGNGNYLPHLLGHEGCGIVVQCGMAVQRVKPGDRVVMHWRKASGIESPLPRYVLNKQAVITSGRVTTFNELSIVSENRLTPVPNDTPVELCALLGCGLSTALATMENEAGLKMGQTVLILGFGGLGVNLLRAAKLMRASEVVVCDIHDWKRDVARRMGADGYIDAKLDVTAWPMRSGFDVVIDTTGNRQIIELTIGMATSRFIMVGHPPPGVALSIPNAVQMFAGEGKVIKATQGGGFIPDQHIPRYVKLWRRGELDVSDIITDRFSLDDINKGIDLVRAGRASRVLVEIES